MLVRIRFNYAETVRRTVNWNRHAALVMSSLLTPVAVMAWVLGCWRLAADLNWARSFAISDGFFSHWQVWIALGIGVQFCAILLQRYAGESDPPVAG